MVNICTSDDLQFDQTHLWHPYTSLTNPLPCYPVNSASGATLTLDDGRQLVDGMSSWWAAIHGYNHPQLNQALQQQAAQLSHVMFGGITHKPAVELARRLVAMTPAPLDAVFLADSGSVSVEVAIKMALQYQVSRQRSDKNMLLTVRGGYHGDTFAAMSVCDPVNGMHGLFQGVLPKHLFADAPTLTPHDRWDERDIDSLRTLLENNHNSLAAIILEPVVQGAGGMRFYHPTYLKRVRELCDQHDVLLICDEIATGFGRTGKLFACEHADVVPDIMCVGKALTGGYMTLAATIAQRHVAEQIGQGPGGGSLMHGPTFMGNPLACAVACASLDIIAEGHWQQQVAAISQQLERELARCNGLTAVNQVRVFGAIGVVELAEPLEMASTQAWLVEQGVWIRPFGRLLYIMPPYIIEPDQLRRLTDAMLALCQRLSS
ncbi:adenosylmethionine--8-amino-7-oxononanoate transaminase [Aliidiomarina soli]|uniref:Adenosylmethionine-8-amino-7-oxononanoate aminotransferase n=1 Tax=Aliidiomarina soli TaxID=1928574 RepID=A0A432WME8_9GAMM|nr:adenosylmethionine--8-amino-7-oxononanoate transaminase [Aliidiomarina soli]RUO34992.1 adenosylmethionine--8-amino-7-oxononanoate transaminase [Aliidiomarina soli]